MTFLYLIGAKQICQNLKHSRNQALKCSTSQKYNPEMTGPENNPLLVNLRIKEGKPIGTIDFKLLTFMDSFIAKKKFTCWLISYNIRFLQY